MQRLILPALTALLVLVYGVLSNEPTLEGSRLLNVLRIAAIVSGAILATQLVSYALVEIAQTRADGRRPSHLLRLLILAVLYSVTAVILLRTVLGVDVISVAAASAVTAVVIGFALQPTLGNVFSGIALRLEWPAAMQMGDVVAIGDQRGRLETLTWRSVTIRTPEGVRVVVPNEKLASEVVTVFPQAELSELVVRYDTRAEVPPETFSAIVAGVMQTMPGVVRGRTRVDCGQTQFLDNGLCLRSHDIRYVPLDIGSVSAVEAVLRERLWYALDRAGLNGSAASDAEDRARLDMLVAEHPAFAELDPARRDGLVRAARRLAYANGAPVSLAERDETTTYALIAGNLLERRGGAAIGTLRGATALGAVDKSLRDLASELTMHIGPVADWLVRDAAAETTDLYTLYNKLSVEIDAPEQRAAFLENAPRREARWHGRGVLFSLHPAGPEIARIEGALEAAAGLVLFRLDPATAQRDEGAFAHGC